MHTIIVVSHLRHNRKGVEEQNSEWISEINGLCPESKKASLQNIVLDIEAQEQEVLAKNASDLWRLVASMDKFACRDLEALAADLDDQREETRRLQTELDQEKIQRLETLNVEKQKYTDGETRR